MAPPSVQRAARPLPTLASIIGQPGPTRLLARLVARDRLAHALLLEGLPGCGRMTVARALCAALLCNDRRDGDACGACASCRLAHAGTHPDLVSLPHDSERDDLPADLIREQVVQAAQETPLIGSRRAFIIPGAERLNLVAANALLKVLEEPPPGTHLVMTTSNAASVLKTIRSRAQLYRLQPLGAADLARVLEQGGMPAADAARKAAEGGGSHRGLWDDEVAPAPLAALLRLVAGEFHSRLVAEVVDGLPQKEHKDEEGRGRTLAAEQRRMCRHWLNALLQALRPRLSDEDGEAVAGMIDKVLQAQRDLQRNLQPRLVIEGLAL